ncbi:MAG: hypothetical protein NTAFB01_00880 [Nitrospira sp.]
MSPHPIGITELETGRCLEVNDACLEVFGFRRDEVVEQTTFLLGIWPDPQERVRLIDRLTAEGKVRNLEVPMRTKEGALRRFLISTDLVALKGKRCLLTIGNDITERKQAEEELRRLNETLEQRIMNRTAELKETNERLQAEITEREQMEALLREQKQEFLFLADNVPAHFSYIDTELRYRFVNKRYEELFGRPLVELTGQYVKDVVGEANFRTIEPHLREALIGRETSFLYPKVLPNVDTRWMNVHYTPDRDEAGRIRGVLALATDVTFQKRSELALQQNQLVLQEKREELQRLTDKLFMTQDSERQRIARDLHDDFSQRLAALVLDVASLQRSPLLSELIGKALEPVREELTQLSDDLHNLAYRLHPPLLQHAGLQATIEDYIHKTIERTGLYIILTVKNLPGVIPLDWSICLFRVFQESLQNIVKHAKASEVLVGLSGSSKGVGLSVTDNGKGFDARDKSGHQKGMGLFSMKERLRLVNGLLNIHSRPADGTTVCAWIPFQGKTP